MMENPGSSAPFLGDEEVYNIVDSEGDGVLSDGVEIVQKKSTMNFPEEEREWTGVRAKGRIVIMKPEWQEKKVNSWGILCSGLNC